MISLNSSLGVSASLGTMLINRGAELECRTGKATDRTPSQKEETGNEGTEDHKHAYEGSGG